MSKIILFFLLISPLALALDEVCPPEDIQSQCYQELCKNAKDNVVPLSAEAFQSEMQNFKFELPQEKKKDFESYIASVKRFQSKREKFLNASKPETIAETISSDFMENDEIIDRIVSGKIAFTESNGKFEAIVSDLNGPQSKFYQNLADAIIPIKEMVADFKKRARTEWTPIIFLKFYPLMVEYYKKHPSPNFVALEVSLKVLKEGSFTPKNLQKITDGLVNQDVFGMMAERFKDVKPMLATAFRNFRNEIKASNTPKMVEENLIRSCKIAQYFLDQTKNRDLEAEYKKAQQNSIEKMKTIFLPMLSSHTRDYVLSQFNENLFVPLSKNPDIYPDFNQLTSDMDDVGDLEIKGYFDSEESLKTDLDARTCDSTISIPDGAYKMGQIYIPFSTIALGHGDTVTHEVGHWLSFILSGDGISPESKQNLLALRACITSFYKNPGSTTNPKYKDDGIKTEEDFADWFDFTMNSNMKSHFTCDATKMVPMFAHYIAGNKIPSMGELYTAPPEFTHSNDIFRELHELLVKGRTVPKACNQLMQIRPDAPKACKLP